MGSSPIGTAYIHKSVLKNIIKGSVVQLVRTVASRRIVGSNPTGIAFSDKMVP